VFLGVTESFLVNQNLFQLLYRGKSGTFLVYSLIMFFSGEWFWMEEKSKKRLAFFLGFSFFSYILAKTLLGKLTAFELIMSQLFISGAGIYVSFIRGEQSAQEAANDIIKPHARSAFRRILVLYNRLFALAQEVEKTRIENKDNQKLESELDKIRFILQDQIQTIDSSLEDWRDIVPDEVAEAEENLENRIESRGEE